MAEDAWNRRDPAKVTLAYTIWLSAIALLADAPSSPDLTMQRLVGAKAFLKLRAIRLHLGMLFMELSKFRELLHHWHQQADAEMVKRCAKPERFR